MGYAHISQVDQMLTEVKILIIDQGKLKKAEYLGVFLWSFFLALLLDLYYKDLYEKDE